MFRNDTINKTWVFIYLLKKIAKCKNTHNAYSMENYMKY